MISTALSTSPWIRPSMNRNGRRRSSLARLRDEAEGLAAAYGHLLEPWQHYGTREIVSYCISCNLSAVVVSHSREDPPFGGSVLRTPCDGTDTIPYWPEVSLG